MPQPVFKMYIKNLRSKVAVELFLQEVRKQQGHVYVSDIADLVEEDPNYPIKKILTDIDTFTDRSKENIRSVLMKRIDLPSRQVEALQYHDLFKQLSGNPSSIVILAAYYCYPFHQKKMTLTELYKRVIKDGKENSDFPDDVSSELKATISKNNISLTLTTEASIKLLKESEPKHLEMLYYLGCLPGGVMLEQLKKMRTNVDESIRILDDMAFLEHGEEKIVLTTHLIEHV